MKMKIVYNTEEIKDIVGNDLANKHNLTEKDTVEFELKMGAIVRVVITKGEDKKKFNPYN